MSNVTDGKGVKYEEILRLKETDQITLIDVRNESEIEETGKLPGSTHIPRKLHVVGHSDDVIRMTRISFLAVLPHAGNSHICTVDIGPIKVRLTGPFSKTVILYC